MKSPKILYEGKYIRMLAQDSWEYAERVNCTGVVFIIALTDSNKMVLCEQYRVPVGQRVIEVPAGLVNDEDSSEEETFEEAARRELLEETGFDAGRVVYLTKGPAAAGSASAIVHFYRALDLKKVSSGGGDASENITVHEVAISEIDGWLKKRLEEGKLVDPKVYSALYLLQSHHHEGTQAVI